MQTKIGIDILSKKRFLESVKNGGDPFLHRTFTPQELRQNTKEQLASIFCLKETLLKALQLPIGSWQNISTNRKPNGKVECSFLDKVVAQNIISLDTSISHEGELIISVASVILK